MSDAHEKRTSNGAQKLGRSSVTGQFVLKPVEKKGSGLSLSRVRAATRKVVWNKKG
jgi:hypothetical protein